MAVNVLMLENIIKCSFRRHEFLLYMLEHFYIKNALLAA